MVLYEILSGRVAIADPTPTHDGSSSPARSREGRTLTSLVCIFFLLLALHILVNPLVTFIHFALSYQLLYYVNIDLLIDKLFMICYCCLMQFDPILNDPDGRTQLPKYIDPALTNDYPLDAVWKVGNYCLFGIFCIPWSRFS